MFVGILLIARRLSWSRRIGLSLLVPYLFMVLTATVLVRTPAESANVVLEPFRTYLQYAKSDFWEFQIQANILLFIPVGFLLSMVMNRAKLLPIIIGIGISVAIEIIQLLTHRGTFEIDDLISNFFGVLIGCIIFLPIRMLMQMDEENKKLQSNNH